MIAVVFSCSWIPLNICNIIVDFQPHLFQFSDEQTGALVIGICHLLVLSSACSNPVLYGWLNENFRREFVKVLCKCCKNSSYAPICCRSSMVNNGTSSVVVCHSRPTNCTTHLDVIQHTEVRSDEALQSSASQIEML